MMFGRRPRGQGSEKATAHEQRSVTVRSHKEAMVDVGIADVVTWLNSFDSVQTEYSCEGEYEKGDFGRGPDAYVSFSCHDLNDLAAVCAAVAHTQTVPSLGNVKVFLQNGRLVFRLGLESRWCLEELKRRIC